MDTAQALAAARELSAGARFDEAAEVLEALLAAEPGRLDALELLTMARLNRSRFDLAVDPARRALALSPTPLNRRRLIAALSFSGRRQEAIEEIGRTLEAGDDDAGLRLMQGDALAGLLRFDEALATYRDAAARFPDDLRLASALANVCNYAPGLDPSEVLEAHKGFGRVLGRTSAPRPAWRVTPDPDRPLRVGVLSSDLRTHSVAYFLEPLLEHADRSRVSFFCFSTHTTEDEMTQRLRRHAAGWHAMGGRTPATVAHRVLTERIDVLVDLGGLTTSTAAMQVMHQRPAPVLVTYLGYPNTTGVEAIRYRIVDSITDPPGAERLAVEELVRLDPCFLCYRPSGEAPEPAGAPPAASGPPTFGSFNNSMKLNDAVIALWARAVGSIPGARLLLKDSGVAFDAPTFRESLAARFVASGLPRKRLELLDHTRGVGAHLALYDRVAVALDPFPYNGTTTTCEALWMGVPVVTLAGAVHASRVGASLLTAVGVPEFIARTPDEYASLAASLASDAPRLAGLRRSLRPRVAASPLCDAPTFARRFEAALRGLWGRWCREKTGATAPPPKI